MMSRDDSEYEIIRTLFKEAAAEFFPRSTGLRSCTERRIVTTVDGRHPICISAIERGHYSYQECVGILQARCRGLMRSLGAPSAMLLQNGDARLEIVEYEQTTEGGDMYWVVAINYGILEEYDLIEVDESKVGVKIPPPRYRG